ncbi:uracil-DNA glycosylase [Gloeobacter morelensis]|uniref:Type-4 uracil-DNA glycosylase n=1 Tax=Gloeobacter morelensis MG652769 TaxID=2781736 RepID=A0ABY3PRN9_9CYAN|nr:uracil-DNA glycosylase [Gloeobacter morelensis]UFP96388.1 uracil-DNA glycosylase [Gloeobacter morelensis MG652769]
MAEEQVSLFNLSEAAPTQVQFERIPRDAAVSIVPGTYSDFEQIRTHCNACFRCELGKTRTHAVVGRGNPEALLMVIGEGPGENEDLTGIPFVGKAGQLLDKILEAVQFDTEKDVYIANIVKCRPPGNRKPAPEEMKACLGYLNEQIRMVDPKILLLAGGTAVEGLTGDKRGITKLRGQWLQWQGRWVMPFFHPAFLLRNPSRDAGSPKWLAWQDIQQVRAKYDEFVAAR